MKPQLSPDQIGLLLLIQRLTSREQPLTGEGIRALAEIKLPGVANHYPVLFEGLSEMGLFSGPAEGFQLTSLGKDLVQTAAAEHSLVGMFYDAYYQAAENSLAHAAFCERVYGADLAQHGLADLEQLGILIEEIGLEPGMTFLDFGCGSGRITEYLAEITSSSAAGVDKSPRAIELARERTAAKANTLRFYWADIHKGRGELPEGPFDRAVAIDSLFFAPSQRLVVETLLGMLVPGGILGVFYFCAADQDPAQTPLEQILAEDDLAYQAVDLSAQNHEHWTKKKMVLLDMEEEFTMEGSSFLFKNRLAECTSFMEEAQRTLYIIHKD